MKLKETLVIIILFVLLIYALSSTECPIKAIAHSPLQPADFDHDGDVDLHDFYVFQQYFGEGLYE